jgi:hypothetical protein
MASWPTLLFSSFLSCYKFSSYHHSLAFYCIILCLLVSYVSPHCMLLSEKLSSLIYNNSRREASSWAETIPEMDVTQSLASLPPEACSSIYSSQLFPFSGSGACLSLSRVLSEWLLISSCNKHPPQLTWTPHPLVTFHSFSYPKSQSLTKSLCCVCGLCTAVSVLTCIQTARATTFLLVERVLCPMRGPHNIFQ